MTLPAWPSEWGWPKQRKSWLVGAFVFALIGIIALTMGNWGTTLGCLVATAIGVLLWQNARVSHGSPEFINAVTLTDARQAPVDSWVHFFRFKRYGFGLVVVLTSIGLALVAVCIATWVVVPVTDVNPIVIRIVGTIVGVIGLAFFAAGIGSAVARSRLGTFGKAPVGYAFGPNALMIVNLAGVRHVQWSAIADVVPEQRVSRDPEFVVKERGTMWLTIVDAQHERISLPAETTIHPWVLYGAVVQAWQDTTFRKSLGTSQGQKALEAMVAEVSSTRKPKRR